MTPLCEIQAEISEQFWRKIEVHLVLLFIEHSTKRRAEELNFIYEHNIMVPSSRTPYFHEYSAVANVKDGEETFSIRSTITVRDLPKLKNFDSAMTYCPAMVAGS